MCSDSHRMIVPIILVLSGMREKECLGGCAGHRIVSRTAIDHFGMSQYAPLGQLYGLGIRVFITWLHPGTICGNPGHYKLVSVAHLRLDHVTVTLIPVSTTQNGCPSHVVLPQLHW